MKNSDVYCLINVLPGTGHRTTQASMRLTPLVALYFYVSTEIPICTNCNPMYLRNGTTKDIPLMKVLIRGFGERHYAGWKSV